MASTSKKAHKLFSIQPVQNIYIFLDEIEQIKIQALNKRHYKVLIPTMLYYINSFGQRLISMNLQQLTLYNIPMRTRYYSDDFRIKDLQFASFAVIKDLIVITGGIDQSDQTVKGSQYRTLLYTLNMKAIQSMQKTFNYDQKEITSFQEGPKTLHPRVRHSSATDGKRYIYLFGSQYSKASNSVEKYDQIRNVWIDMPQLIQGGINLSSCYFKNGMNQESLWVFDKMNFQKYDLQNDFALWEEVKVDGIVNIQKTHRQGMQQLNIHQIMIFGGEDKKQFNNITETYFFNTEGKFLTQGPSLPEAILPESPSYTLNCAANFYFLGNINTIYRFSKQDSNWKKIIFEQNQFN